MLKKTLTTILSLTLATVSFGQEETPPAEQPELKSNTLSASALWVMGGFLHANYGKLMNDGKNEIQFMLGILPEADSFDDDSWETGLDDGYMFGFKGGTGGKATYRIYRKGNAKGLFYQAQVRMFTFKWGHKSGSDDWKEVNTFGVYPGVYLGYKYVPSFLLKGRLLVEAFAGGFYDTANAVDGDVTLTFEDGEKQAPGFGPDFNLAIGFSF